MAITISPFAMIDLIVGAMVAFVVVGTITIILILRRKHRRALLSMNTTSVRRLSGFPGGNVSMMDEDFARLPRARAVLRRSTRIPQGSPRPYAAIPSSESLPRYQVLRKPPGALSSNPTVPDADPQQQSWPLPRRLTRSSNAVIPLARLKGASESVSTERQLSLPRSQTEPRTAYKTAIPTGTPLSEVSPNAALRPKPLTIKKRRSASQSTLLASSKAAEKESEVCVVEPAEGTARNLQAQRFPRSTSLCTRQPGLAPTEPVPPLPPNVVSKNFQSLRSPTERRGSTNSLLSGDTSVLNDGFSKRVSQADTDITSTGMVSPIRLGTRETDIQVSDGYKWDSGDITRAVSPIDAPKQARLRPQLQTQHSFRASIQQQLPRSASSGLSISLLDLEPSQNTSCTTLNRNPSPLHKVNISRALGQKGFTKQAPSPPSLLSRNSMFEIHEDPKGRPASAILQDVSGNAPFGTYRTRETKGSPMHNGVNPRPLSIATSDPFQYEQMPSPGNSKTSNMKGRAKGHRRQNCVRISNIPFIIPSPGGLQSTCEEIEEQSKTSMTPDQKHDTPRAKPRLPCRPTFDPVLTTPTPAPRASRLSIHPSSSLLHLHDPSSRTPSPLSTPTRQASTLHPSSTHPNRKKPIFDTPLTAPFTFTTPQKPSILTNLPKLEPASNLTDDRVLSSALEDCEDPSLSTEGKILEPRPSSTLFPFPSPPHPPRVGGPRALPPTAWRNRSPNRGRVAKVNSSGSWAPHTRVSGTSPKRDLKRIVEALRRGNSDAGRLLDFERSDSLRKGHERYCSLGGNEDREMSGDEVDK